MSAIGELAERSDGYHRVPLTDVLIAAAAAEHGGVAVLIATPTGKRAQCAGLNRKNVAGNQAHPDPRDSRSDLLRLAENDETVDADKADGKDAERPPGVGTTNIQEGADRPQRGREEPDETPVGTATEQ
jgi:hypothetical protein